jgi:tetratricopeptide (TPR) repeat protein
VALAFVCVPARAHAQELPVAAPATEAAAAEARRLTSEGLELFEQQRYDDAIARFEAAYASFPAHGLLYNLAQAQRLKGDMAGAAESYRAFLRHDPDGPLSGLARQHLRACEEAALERSTPGVESTALPAPPAPASSAPAAPTKPAPAWLDSPRTALPARDERRPGRVAALVSFATSGVFLGLGAYFAIRADRASGVISDVFEDRGQWSERAAEVERAGKRDEKLAIASTITGAVAAGVGVWCWTW